MSATLVWSPLLAAVFIAVLGVLIKYFGMVELVAGYDPETVTDEDALAAFVGTNTLYVAVLTAAVAAVEYTRPFDGYRAVWLPYVLAVGLLAVRMVRGARRYEAPRE
jgi:hypothetical protein